MHVVFAYIRVNAFAGIKGQVFVFACTNTLQLLPSIKQLPGRSEFQKGQLAFNRTAHVKAEEQTKLTWLRVTNHINTVSVAQHQLRMSLRHWKLP